MNNNKSVNNDKNINNNNKIVNNDKNIDNNRNINNSKKLIIIKNFDNVVNTIFWKKINLEKLLHFLNI